ncbi:MAG TPA: hypothetical protein PLO41_18415, partial [Rubrivivax sp.]|nr:hypothetical protein [Rubrivivax sp.]
MSGATADGTAANGALLSVGASDGGRQWVNARYSVNGAADSNSARRWTDDALILAIDGDGAVTGKAALVGFVPGGVTISSVPTGSCWSS